MGAAPLRVLLLSPATDSGGNAVSAGRLAAGLRARGIGVRLVATGTPDLAARLQRTLASFRPDVIHALHARKAGAAWLRHALPGDPPLVITLTGTEIHRDLGDPVLSREVVRALESASMALSHGRSLLAAAVAAVPGIAGRTRRVPKGAVLPPRDPGFDLRRRAGLPRDALVFLLPGGLREVKDPSFAVAPLERLRTTDPRVAFVHCGPVLESGAEARLRSALAGCPRAVSIGNLPAARMGSAMAQASVVLNTSRAEGLSNAVVEAQLAARAVLVADIAANRELVDHGRTGLVYRAGDPAAFLRQARRLARDPSLRRRLGTAARRAARERFDPGREIDAVVEVYEAVRRRGPSPDR